MAKDDSLIIDLPSDDILIDPNAAKGDGSVKGDTSKPDSAPVIAVEKPAPVEADIETPDEAFKSIKRDLDEARKQSEDRAREVAQGRRDIEAANAERARLTEELTKSTDQNLRETWQRVQSEHQQIVNGIHATKSELDSAKAAYEAAFESGNAKAASAAQERIALAASDLRTYENGKVGAESEIQRVERHIRAKMAQPTTPETKPAPATAPVQTPEGWIDSIRSQFGSRPAEWLEKNRQFVTDTSLNKKMIKFSEYWMDVKGKPLNSPDFIQALNAEFLPQEGNMADDDEPRAVVKPAPLKQRTAVASAPVSRGGEFFSSRNPDAAKVRLPVALAKFCDDAKLNKTSYALGIVKDIKSGKLPKNYLDDDYPHELPP